MALTLAGLVITMIISLLGVYTNDNSQKIRVSLAVLTLLGFCVAGYSAIRQEIAKREEARHKLEAEQKANEAIEKLDAAKRQLEDLRTMLAFVRTTVGDLGKLNAIGGEAKYYIRIAADNKKERLEPYLAKIESVFKGASQSGLVDIRQPKQNSHNYELVFGQGLEMAAAEVFYRLATLHKFPPVNQIPTIVPEISPASQ